MTDAGSQIFYVEIIIIWNQASVNHWRRWSTRRLGKPPSILAAAPGDGIPGGQDQEDRRDQGHDEEHEPIRLAEDLAMRRADRDDQDEAQDQSHHLDA